MNAALHNLTGAYAAQALADTERVSFERHLDACPGCAQEVRELAEITARLGAAVATAPPPGLWDRVRAEALATRQVPPVTRRAGGGGAGRGRAGPSPRCGSGRSPRRGLSRGCCGPACSMYFVRTTSTWRGQKASANAG